MGRKLFSCFHQGPGRPSELFIVELLIRKIRWQIIRFSFLCRICRKFGFATGHILFSLVLFQWNTLSLLRFWQEKHTLHVSVPSPGHVVKHGLDWISKTWTGLVKHGLVKHGLVKHGLVKHGLVKHGLVKHGLVKHGLVKHGLVKHGLTRCFSHG